MAATATTGPCRPCTIAPTSSRTFSLGVSGGHGDWRCFKISSSEQDPPSLRILIAEDHRLFRRGIRDLLTDAGHAVVGEAADGESAVRLARELRPDLILMDIEMPRLDGVAATRAVNALGLDIRVLMLTVSLSEDLVVGALLAGACGYLLKDAHEQEILAAVSAVSDGGPILPPLVAQRLVEHVRGEQPGPRRVDYGLDDREIEVLGDIVAGRDNNEIASRLFLSTGTIKATIGSIFAKLGAANRVQAAVVAVRDGIVDAP